MGRENEGRFTTSVVTMLILSVIVFTLGSVLQFGTMAVGISGFTLFIISVVLFSNAMGRTDVKLPVGSQILSIVLGMVVVFAAYSLELMLVRPLIIGG